MRTNGGERRGRRGHRALGLAVGAAILGTGMTARAADPAPPGNPAPPTAANKAAAGAPTVPPESVASGARGNTTTGGFTLDPVYVSPEKRDELAQDVPISFTTVSGRTIEQAGIFTVDETARYVPNLIFSQFTAARESFPFVRGIGSGRNSPAVTTYVDGVPQLSFATSNQQLVDVDRIEFLRGPQGTLYGRNTLGGVINLYTRRPGNEFVADIALTAGSYDLYDARGVVSGPIIRDKLFFSISGGYFTREGYTVNDVTGHDLDNKEESFGRFQLLWTPTREWDVRLIVNGEHDHDGDFALGDLGQVRRDMGHVSRDFEGFARRDFWQPSLVATYKGREVEFTSVTSYQFWRSHERTDLDYTAADLIRRDNNERQKSFYQEARLASAADRPVSLSKEAKLAWLVGAAGFTSDFSQTGGNEFRPGAVQLFGLPAPLTQVEDARLSDWGIGMFGQATLTLWDKLDLTVGLRYDYEQKGAHLTTTTTLTPPGFETRVRGDDDFDQFSPRVAVGYHVTKDVMAYASAAKGYKSGGFGAQAPAGQESFGEETSWSYEVGIKTSWFKDRLVLNADAFYVHWDDLQLDTPTAVPAQFFIQNAGRAYSKGFEVELIARPAGGLELFAGVGFTHAKFGGGSRNQGASVSDNDLPFAPETTWNVGGQYTMKLGGDASAYVRAEVFGTGRYFYDASNGASQDSYFLANFRAGVAGQNWRVEGWVRNAFDEEYVPLAFPFQLAPSGYVGERGAPQAVGITVGFSY